MSKRISKPIITDVTRQQAEDAMTAYADAQAAVSRITAEVELECIRIRDSRAKEISDLQLRATESQAILEAYARENRDTIFQRRRSLDLPNGTIGFRTATPRVRAVKGYTLAAALELMQSFHPEYTRTTTELDRQRLILERDSPEAQAAMRKCGLQVTQDETFFITVPEEKLT